jgi:transcriptional regulator with XRE-family HTH domain
MLRMTVRQWAEIERGEANPTMETLERIGRAYGFQVGFVGRGPRVAPDGDGPDGRDI